MEVLERHVDKAEERWLVENIETAREKFVTAAAVKAETDQTGVRFMDLTKRSFAAVVIEHLETGETEERILPRVIAAGTREGQSWSGEVMLMGDGTFLETTQSGFKIQTMLDEERGYALVDNATMTWQMENWRDWGVVWGEKVKVVTTGGSYDIRCFALEVDIRPGISGNMANLERVYRE